MLDRDEDELERVFRDCGITGFYDRSGRPITRKQHNAIRHYKRHVYVAHDETCAFVIRTVWLGVHYGTSPEGRRVYVTEVRSKGPELYINTILTDTLPEALEAHRRLVEADE